MYGEASHSPLPSLSHQAMHGNLGCPIDLLVSTRAIRLQKLRGDATESRNIAAVVMESMMSLAPPRPSTPQIWPDKEKPHMLLSDDPVPEASLHVEKPHLDLELRQTTMNLLLRNVGVSAFS